MSKKQSTNATAHDAADTAPGGGDGMVMPLPPNAPDTPAVRALWPALTAQPGATTPDLAEAAKVSRSTAAKALASLQSAGLVNRIAGGRKGARLFPDRWEPTTLVTPAEPAERSRGRDRGRGDNVGSGG